MPSNVGFVGTRFSGTDGVSLESAKWAQILWDNRHVSYWYGGKLDRSASVSMSVPEAYFGHAKNVWINERVLGPLKRDRRVTQQSQSSVLQRTCRNRAGRALPCCRQVGSFACTVTA